MSLNIKNSEAHALATELARLRKVSVTQAVLEAIRHELTREKNRHRKSLHEQLIEIGKRCAAHIHDPVSSVDHATLLYDRQGLPRRRERARHGD